MRALKITSILVLLTAMLSFKGNQHASQSVIGNAINNFSLRNIDNKKVSLTDVKNAKGYIIIFTCNHCPFAKLYTKRLNELNTKYKASGLPLLAINSMDTAVYKDESFDMMQKKAQSEKINFPYLSDAKQTVGKNFGAKHTPQAFIIWKEENNWVIKYSGSVDDNGEHPEEAIPLLANAADQLLQGKPISKPETESFGCRIFYRK